MPSQLYIVVVLVAIASSFYFPHSLKRVVPFSRHWPFYTLFMQADSAILALSCSGMVLGALPVRQANTPYACSKLVYCNQLRPDCAIDLTLFLALFCRVSPSKTPVRPRSPRVTSHWNPALSSEAIVQGSKASSLVCVALETVCRVADQ